MITIDATLRHALEVSGPDLILTLDPALQGLPETAHGGSVLAVFDTLAGATAPREVSGIYRRRVPLGLPLTLRRAREGSAETFVLSDQAGGVLVDGRVALLVSPAEWTLDGPPLVGAPSIYALLRRWMEEYLDVTFAPFQDLGRSFDIVDRGFKPKRYPCGGLGHTAIDATLEMREALLPRLSDIAGIKASITRYAAARIGPTYPVSIENAKFSMPYLAATTLLHGAPMLAAFTEPAIADARVRAAARLVSVAIDPEFADIFEESPSRVIVSFADGSRLERLRYYASGTLQFPLTPAQIEAKFMDCAVQAVDKERAGRIFAALQTLGEAPSFDELWPLLRGA